MPFSRAKTWVSNEVLTAADLNAEFDNVGSFITPTGIEDASANVSAMQATADPGGVGTESLATSLLGEIQRIRFVIKRIVGAQWYSAPVVNLSDTIAAADLATDAVETAKIKDLNVTTGKLADGAVTQAKRASLGHQLSSSCGNFTTSSTTAVDVTNLSISITTTGRPVFIGLVHDGSSNAGLITCDHATVDLLVQCLIVRASTTVALHQLGTSVAGVGIPVSDYSVYSSQHPVSSISTIDVPSAGTYTYKIQVLTNSASNTVTFNYAKLIAFEL